MRRKASAKRPIFQPVPAEHYLNLDSESNVYVRSTHYSSQPGGSLSAASEILSVPDSESEGNSSHVPAAVYSDNFSYELETDFSAYLASLNEETHGNEDIVGGQHVPKIRRVVSNTDFVFCGCRPD